MIYNESIDRQPSFRSENIIVSDVKTVISGSDTVTQITAYSGTASATTYTCTNDQINAFVLNEKFERIYDSVAKAYVKREIQKGDVIRFGYAPNKYITNIELVFDISEGAAENKAIATGIAGQSIALTAVDQSKEVLSYYARVGNVTKIDDKGEYCAFTIPDTDNPVTNSDNTITYNDTTSVLRLGSSYPTRSMYLYDYKSTATEPVSQSQMQNVYVGDMIYVQINKSLNINYIYIVKYVTTATQSVETQSIVSALDLQAEQAEASAAVQDEEVTVEESTTVSEPSETAQPDTAEAQENAGTEQQTSLASEAPAATETPVISEQDVALPKESSEEQVGL